MKMFGIGWGETRCRFNFGRKMIAHTSRIVVLFAALTLVGQTYGQWTEQVLETFNSESNSGVSPYGPLTQAKDGALYGLTSFFGANGSGTLFKINCDGSGFTILHSFGSYSDGENPQGGLLQGADGALYGTTFYGGNNSVGTVFKINPDGSGYITLHNFGVDSTDGSYPGNVVLVQDRVGALYGTTSHGGVNGYGTIFKINPDGGNYTVLHSFAADDGYGISPDAGVILGSGGILYGATPQAGTNGGGTVYQINPDGSGYTIIHTFGANEDGKVPYCALVQGNDGALYGTTTGGGVYLDGTVFRLSPLDKSYRTLYSFNPYVGDLEGPQAGLVQAASGVLYGTCYSGGDSGCGGVFTINTNGSGYFILYGFPGEDFPGANSAGIAPHAAVIVGQDGALYGTTLSGGTLPGGIYDNGTVFRLAPPTPPQLSLPAVFPDGSLRFSLTAPANQNCRVDVSTNLVSWTALTNILSATNAVQILDAFSHGSGQRFYRASYTGQ